MADWLPNDSKSDREIELKFLGYWAIYLAFGVALAITTGQVWLFFLFGFGIPVFLVATFVFAAVSVYIFMIGVLVTCKIASLAFHLFLWNRFRFHHGAWAQSKDFQKIEDRRRTVWGFHADAGSGFALARIFHQWVACCFARWPNGL